MRLLFRRKGPGYMYEEYDKLREALTALYQREDGADDSVHDRPDYRRDTIASDILFVLLLRTDRLREALFELAGVLIFVFALFALILI